MLELLMLAVAQEPKFPPFPEQDALAYELSLDVDPEQQRLTGTVGYSFRAVEPLRSIRLHARPSTADWKVSFQAPGGGELATTWRKDVVEVALPRAVAAGDEVAFGATIAGRPPGGFYFKANRYGEQLAFTDHYSIRARGWLPCEDHPADRAKFALRLTYPAGNEALVSGAMRAVEAAPGGADRQVLHSETRSDIPPYMFAVVVGPFARVDEAGDPRLRPHFVYRRDVDKAKLALVHHAEWLRIMERTFGRYAYAKYTVVQCPTRWGGFEAPSNVLLTERIFDLGDQGIGIMAHELVHMWFGDAVGYAEWHEVWLSEGFASYFGPWLHAQTGGPGLVERLAKMRERWRGAADGRNKPVRWDGFAHPDFALNANTYPKGAWILHMLRGELGDDKFFAALREYYVGNSGKSVVTADLVSRVERVTGEELSWFFDQWLDRVGCPELRVDARGDKIHVEQVQRGAPYRFRLPLRWTDARGERVDRVFRIEDRSAALDAGGEVRDLVVDPRVELLFRAAR